MAQLTIYCTPQEKVKTEDIQYKIVPVALFFAFSLVLSNKAYIYLSVSYLQVRLVTDRLFYDCALTVLSISYL